MGIRASMGKAQVYKSHMMEWMKSHYGHIPFSSKMINSNVCSFTSTIWISVFVWQRERDKERERGFTLLGFEAVIIHTHCALLSYWIGKLGDVKVPDGPWRLLPHVFTVNRRKKHNVIVISNCRKSVAVLATTICVLLSHSTTRERQLPL